MRGVPTPRPAARVPHGSWWVKKPGFSPPRLSGGSSGCYAASGTTPREGGRKPSVFSPPGAFWSLPPPFEGREPSRVLPLNF